jgi:hypothetical protein
MTSVSESIPEIHYRGSFDVEQILGKLIRNVSVNTRSFKLIVSLDDPVGQVHQIVSSINLTDTFGARDRSVFRLEDWEITHGVHLTFTFHFVRGYKHKYQCPSALGRVKFDAHLDRYDGRYHLELHHMKNLPIPERDCSLDQLTAWIRNSRSCSGKISVDMRNYDLVLEIYRIIQSFPRSRISCKWYDDRSLDSTEKIVEFNSNSNSTRDSEQNTLNRVLTTIVLPLILYTIFIMIIRRLQPYLQ